MSVIPVKIYRLVEKKLLDRWTMVPRARAALREAQRQAVNLSSPATDAIRVSSGPGSRTQSGAMKILAAEERLDAAGKWQEAFALTDKAFPWETTPEGVVAAYLYGNRMTQEEVCRATGWDRQTVRRRKDHYVAHCALFAAALGLIDIQGEEEKEPWEKGFGNG